MSSAVQYFTSVVGSYPGGNLAMNRNFILMDPKAFDRNFVSALTTIKIKTTS